MKTQYIVELTHQEPLSKRRRKNFNYDKNYYKVYYVMELIPVYTGEITTLMTLTEHAEEAKWFDTLASAQHFIRQCTSVGFTYGMNLTFEIREVDAESAEPVTATKGDEDEIFSE